MAKQITSNDPKTPNNQITDVLSEGTVRLVEAKKNGRIRIEGEFGRWDRATANKRFYPKGLWESNINRMQASLENRKVIGELDHPDDGKTSLKRASHVITNLWIEDDGRLMGEAEIVPTRMGRDLEALFRSDVPIGISSRGYGSTKANPKGEDVVQEDYKLVTFDFVAEPADNTAYPTAFFEGVEIAPETTMDEGIEHDKGVTNKQADALAKKFAAKVMSAAGDTSDTEEADLSTTAALRQEFEATLLARIDGLRESVRAEVRKEMMEDPEIGAAKGVLEQVSQLLGSALLPEDIQKVVAGKDQEISDLNDQLAELNLKLRESHEMVESVAKAAKTAGYRYFLERLVSEDEEASLIRKCVGDVTLYETKEVLSAKVESIRNDIDKRRQIELTERQERDDAERVITEEREKLSDGLHDAMTANKALALQLYAERKLRNHPESDKIRSMLEHTGITSQEQVDDLLENFRDDENEDDWEAARDRVRSMSRGGRQNAPLKEDNEPAARTNGGGVDRDYLGLGASLHEIKKLAGMNH
jgi:hypothetical protein